MRRLLTSIGALLSPVAASAHPDHTDGASYGLAHYVSDPFHVATGLLTIGAVLLVVWAWRVRQRRAVVSSRPR
jgi:hydrogenase/urease accessory protein HupE